MGAHEIPVRRWTWWLRGMATAAFNVVMMVALALVVAGCFTMLGLLAVGWAFG